MKPAGDWAGIIRTRCGRHNPRGKIDLGLMVGFDHHRSGWLPALEALGAEHREGAALLDGFVEVTFNGDSPPRTRPWVGFMHNPPGMPGWFPPQPKPQTVLALPAFRASLPHCRGLFALSEYLADYLRRQVDVPVEVLYLPTVAAAPFDPAAFLASDDKKVIAVGWWLRRLMSIYRLPLGREGPYRKLHLLGRSAGQNDAIRGLMRLEFVHERAPLPARYRDNTTAVEYLADAEYDDLLSRNVVFLDLHDASANNAVVECLVRATPVLVNRLPAVVEYLGPDYPLYFDTLDQAAEKALDFGLVLRAHEYLLGWPTRGRLSYDDFLGGFRDSEVYRGLP